MLDEINAPFFKWFADGKLNVSTTASTATSKGSATGRGDLRSRQWHEVTKVTYKDMLRVSASLPTPRGMGVKKGDRVIIYLPMSIEGVVAMQACARIGATTHRVRRLLRPGPARPHRGMLLPSPDHLRRPAPWRQGTPSSRSPTKRWKWAVATHQNVIVVKRTGADIAISSPAAIPGSTTR